MADPITTEQTKPLDAGYTTSEYKFTKWITIIATGIAVLSAILDTVNTFAGWIPKDSWAFKGIAIVSAVVALGKSIIYTLSRTAVKIAAVKAEGAKPATLDEIEAILASAGKAAPPKVIIPPPPAT